MSRLSCSPGGLPIWASEVEPRHVHDITASPKDITQIVRAALAVADREGLTAMSMVRVAEEAGAGTMSLYTYVPGKAELIDLMVDAVLTERDLPGPDDPRPGDWLEQIELYAERTRAAYRRPT